MSFAKHICLLSKSQLQEGANGFGNEAVEPPNHFKNMSQESQVFRCETPETFFPKLRGLGHLRGPRVTIKLPVLRPH